MANSVNHPISQSSSGGLRRGITVAIVGSGIGFLLAFTGLTTYSARTDGSNLPKSTIGKTGEMKSPGGSAYNIEKIGLGSVEIQDSQIRKSVIQAPKGVWHAPIRSDGRPVG